MSLPSSHPAVRVVEEALAAGPIPGAALALGGPGGTGVAFLGRLSREPGSPPVDADTLYDLASLTKVLCTVPLLVRLIEAGRLDPNAPLVEALPEAAGTSLAAATVLELATHTAGLEANSGLRFWNLPRAAALERALREPRPRPRGDILYSDQGYLVLGHLLERLHGRSLDALAAGLYAEFGLELTFRPDAGRTAPTEDAPDLGRPLQGEVHDENARALGGVAGHAGLFGTAVGVADFLAAMLEGRVVGPEGWRFLTAEHARGPSERRAFGWLLASPGWSGGESAPQDALGHTGFTGTGAWLDPHSGRFHVLLTNRVHPSRHLTSGIGELRRAYNDAAWRLP